MAERRLKLRLGLFVAGALAVLAGLVILFGGRPHLFSSKAKYAVLFPEAPGIAVGTPIRKSGVPIGEVTGLELDPNTGLVRVAVAVDPKYVPRRNEDATITRGLLSGDTAIDFLPKIGGDGLPMDRGDPLPPGSEITGVPPVTARSLLTPASSVISSAQESLNKIVRSFEQLERVGPKIEQASDEIALLARDARLFLPELRKTNDRLQRLIGGDPLAPRGSGNGNPGQVAVFPPAAADPADELPEDNSMRALIRDIRNLVRTAQPAVEDIRGTIRRVEPDVSAAAKSARQAFEGASDVLSPENRKQVAELLKNLNAVASNVLRFSAALQTLAAEAETTVKNFDRRTALTADILADIRAVTKPLAERSEPLARDVAESAAQLNKAITEVRELLRVFARENGTVQKLLTDPALYQSLDAAAVSLARVLARAEKIARDLEVFADKVARRPELIGVGGVVKPSSGLKDAPGAPYPSYRPDWPPAIPASRPGNPEWHPPPVQGYPPRP
jgi:phospholipid/cholesterol/gamma-HCH transport system substrate-binding protein